MTRPNRDLEIKRLKDENAKLYLELQKVARGSDSLEMEAIVSSRNGKGLVMMRWGGEIAQLDVEEAKHLGSMFHEVAAEAEIIAYLYQTFADADLEDEAIGVIIHMVREKISDDRSK